MGSMTLPYVGFILQMGTKFLVGNRRSAAMFQAHATAQARHSKIMTRITEQRQAVRFLLRVRPSTLVSCFCSWEERFSVE